MRTIPGGGQIERRQIEVARAFLDLPSAKDMAGCNALGRADAGQDMPFSPPGFPT
jgi:ketosteroid isomerase-like protein